VLAETSEPTVAVVDVRESSSPAVAATTPVGAPLSLSSLSGEKKVCDLLLSDDRLYMTGSDTATGYVEVFDVSDPTSIASRGFVELAGTPLSRLIGVGSCIYCSGPIAPDELVVLKPSAAGPPSLLSIHDRAGIVSVEDRVLTLGRQSGLFEVMDFSDPARPRRIVSARATGWSWGNSAVSGPYVFGAGGDSVVVAAFPELESR
jgi:hypothetical protein